MNPHFLTKTVVVIPAMNEEGAVAQVVRQWLDLGAAEVRVVDNGSTDSTAACAISAGATVIREPVPGYGSAAWAGSHDVPPTIEWLLFASADGSDYLDGDSTSDFEKAIAAGAELVIGERVSRADSRCNLSAVQRFGNSLCCQLIALGWRTKRFRDMGSLRLIRLSAFNSFALCDRGFGWNIEMQIAAIESGVAIAEVPVGYRPRITGKPKISGSLCGALRAGRDILGMLAKLWVRHFSTG